MPAAAFSSTARTPCRFSRRSSPTTSLRCRPGEGVYATYLTPNGRMITDLELYAGDA